MGEGKGTKERERGVGKAAGDECVFIPGEGPGWQMRSGPTPYRTRRAVRGGHGAAKPDGVIHRYLRYVQKIAVSAGGKIP